MNLASLIEREQSRANTDLIIGMLNNNPALFEELWMYVLENKDPMSRRAAWAADYYSEMHPAILEPRIAGLIENLPEFNSDGLKRHSLRIIARSPIPEGESGTLTVICFNWLQNPTESVAVKMYSMLILERIVHTFPELGRELYEIIDYQLPESTPGFRNAGLKVMKRLSARNVK